MKQFSPISKYFNETSSLYKMKEDSLNKQFKKQISHLKKQFQLLPYLVGKLAEIFYAILCMIYKFIYTIHNLVQLENVMLLKSHIL